MFKKGDRLRRIYSDNDETMRIGTEWVFRMYASKDANEEFIYVENYNLRVLAKNFELIEPTKPTLECVKHVPARAAYTEIIKGPLTSFVNVGGDGGKGVKLLTNSGAFIGIHSKEQVLELASNLTELASYMED